MMGISLIMHSADGVERSFPVHKARTVIGRELLCDVRVAVPAVSNEHCELLLDGDRLRLQDLDSAQGTLHNGAPVRSAELAHEDRVTIGPVTFIVRMTRIGDDGCGGAAQITIVREEPQPGPVMDRPSDD